MLQRLIAILLILVVPVQGFAVPHSHGPMAGALPDDHNQRPHFHLSGHHHHQGHSHDDGHSHDPRPCDNPGDEQNTSTPNVPAQPSNHDDDALYVSGDIGLNLSQNVQPIAEDGPVLWSICVPPTAIDTRCCVDAAASFLDRGDTPIYLITLSLRL